MSVRYANPVYPSYFADPFVWKHEGVYYAVGTGQGDAGKVFPLLQSRDFATWEPVGHALQRPDATLGDTFWAPEVAFRDGVFYLYYSVGFDDKRHQLRVAASETPTGPFVDCGASLVDPVACSFAIDPHPFRDEDGRWYLFYARDFLDCDDGARVGTALMVQPMETMTKLGGTSAVVARARFDWQRFQNERPMYGQVYDWHTLEGPSVRKHAGRYYCFYSGGRWENDTYGVDYAVADEVMGPYRSEGAEGPRLLRTVPGRVIGPGHNSFVLGPDEATEFVVYHAWDKEMTARRMFVDPLRWTEAGPRCDGPSFEPRSL